MSAPFTVATDMPSEEKKHQQHQKHETLNRPESAPPDLNNYGTAEWLIWFIELFGKFLAILSTLFTLILFWNLIENSNDFTCISYCSCIGSFLLITWVLWIPTIVFIFYSLATNDWEFLWLYIFNNVFDFIYRVNTAIFVLSFHFPSINEVVKGNAGEFQIISIILPYMFLNCCWFFFELVKFLREKYFPRKPEQ